MTQLEKTIKLLKEFGIEFLVDESDNELVVLHVEANKGMHVMGMPKMKTEFAFNNDGEFDAIWIGVGK